VTLYVSGGIYLIDPLHTRISYCVVDVAELSDALLGTLTL
jgi:hypothetical protein